MRGRYAELLLLLGLLLLLLLLCTATSFGFALNLRDSKVIRCIDEEKQALLKFKQGLIDQYGMLSSWGSDEEDCCNWKGIKCSNRTGHVVKLDLRGACYTSEPSEPSKYLSGEISSSILGLQHLTYLDLCCNHFEFVLPEFIGTLTKLQYLNLSLNNNIGTIPPQFENLSSLISLDLNWNLGLIEDHSLDWLSHLSSLRYLGMSSVNLSKVVNWLDKVNMLPSLLHLRLSGCDLSTTGISKSIPTQLGNLSSLISLDLSSNFYDHGLIHDDHSLDWLFHLSSLRYLDMNSVNLSKVVNWLDKVNMLPSLLHLRLSGCDLSTTGISKSIPTQLGNLSSLISLDLSSNFYDHGLIHDDHSLDWLSHLSSLRYLDMSSVNLSKVVNWLDRVNMLPSLKELYLSGCELMISMPIPPVLFNASSSSPLSIVDLSHNQLNSSIFPWLFKYANSLVILHLPRNKLEGSIPKAFGNMVALVFVDLSFNNLEGVIPQTLENLHNLQVLDLSINNISGEVLDLSKLTFLRELHLFKNRLNGNLSKVIGKLSTQLQVLDVSSNSFEGVITETHLSTFSNLKILDLSFNSMSLMFSPNWVPPFHLDTIVLSSCKMGTSFPQWLQTQQNFSWLDMSHGGISDIIPNWFWDLSSNIRFLNLSHNQITGTIPFQWFSTSIIDNCMIDLSYNRLSGPLPQFPFGALTLSLSNNRFKGSITSICDRNGSAYAYLQNLNFLDLSNNLLSGELSNCWENSMSLLILNLANNNLSGRIPDFICNHQSLTALHLNNNNFSGELPKSLMNCSYLVLLDLGENRLSGRIPTWIGTSLPDLEVLRLTSNLFMGRMPFQLCHLTSLQILDLSHNNITGTIPECLNNFIVMTQIQSSRVSISLPSSHTYFEYHSGDSSPTYINNLLVSFKGKYLEYSNTLGLVKVIDLSSNKLKGEIPREITNLSGLIGLNLSRNLLTGIIPHNIGDMKILESLDLSRNHLSGIIPPSLVTLTLLSHLNLSNNNLSGRIPTGTQLQSFSAFEYTGNRDLCGLPLLKCCLGDEATQSPQTCSKHEEGNIQEHTNSREHLWFYTSIALGFIVGFWGVCGSLLLKNSWRHAYFRYLERIGDWLCVTIAVSMAKLLRIFKTRCQQ